MGYYAYGTGTVTVAASNQTSLDRILAAMSDQAEITNIAADPSGTTYRISFRDDGKYDERPIITMLNAIAKDTVKGRIQYIDENGGEWRFVFDAKTKYWHQEFADKVYPSDLEGASEELLRNAAEKYIRENMEFRHMVVAQYMQEAKQHIDCL